MSTELTRIIARSPAFHGIDPQHIDGLARVSSVRSLSREEYLWHSSDLATSFTVIRSGLVKIVRGCISGRPNICGIFGAPESVGDAAVLRGIPYPADAIAVTSECSVVEIPRSELSRIWDRGEGLALSCAQALQQKLMTLHAKIGVLSAGAVEERIAALLLYLYDRFGDDNEDSSHFIPVVLMRRELADLVSSRFETVIRIMTRLERTGIVSTTPDGFIIRDLERLQSYSQDYRVQHRRSEPVATSAETDASAETDSLAETE